MRVHVRALLGAMAQLGLDCLDRVTVRDGLACHRMPTKRVMAQAVEDRAPSVGSSRTTTGSRSREGDEQNGNEAHSTHVFASSSLHDLVYNLLECTSTLGIAGFC